MSEVLPKVWALVPASGIGSRMAADRPKQYLPLYSHQTVLDATLSRLLSFQPLSGIMLVLAKDDPYFSSSAYYQASPLMTCDGGAERYDSVLNGLVALLEQDADESDWVMVHDAARPCVRHVDLQALIDVLGPESDGALLGVSIKDTVKRVDGTKSVESTLDRSTLWRAFTPQVFRIGQLKAALIKAKQQGVAITDDASAMELQGYRPRMIEGASDNIKITVPEDLAMAQWFLQQQINTQTSGNTVKDNNSCCE